MFALWRGIAAKAAAGVSRSLLLAACLPAVALAASSQPGTSVINQATLSDGTGLIAQAQVTAQIAPSLELLRYAPQNGANTLNTNAVAGAATSSNAMVEPMQCGGQTYTQAGYSHVATGVLPMLPASIPMAEAVQFNVGEPLFVRVVDASANLSSTTQDKVVVDISDIGSTGDHETITLLETAPDSGVFVGFINTLAGNAQTDCRLSVGKNDQVQATYAGRVSAAAGLVDPFGTVFDSSTGAPLSSVRVSLIDDTTKQPAQVFGDDGAPFPAQVITGSTFTVGSLTYSFPPGEYRFPYVGAAKNYRLVVDQLPPGYVVPSTVPTASLNALPSGPYSIVTGSRGESFAVPLGPPQRVDIPADIATSGLFVSKSAATTNVAVGDFVPYSVQIGNSKNSDFTGVTMTDTLPVGFRYRAGTLQLNGVKLADPLIGADGRTIVASIGTLKADTTVSVTYVAEVTAAAALGAANNIVHANSGNLSSNVASAAVTVTEDLMRSRAILTGRVWEADSCDAKAKKPLNDARIYLEDGRYALTDRYGKWHFDNITPGTHVVQIDKVSLPKDVELLSCEHNTRNAGTTFSQFVDVQGGTLWQVDFYVRKVRPMNITLNEQPQQVLARLASEVKDDTVHFALDIHNSDLALDGTELNLQLPAGLDLVPGSLLLDDGQRSDIQLNNGTVTVGALPADAKGHVLAWDMKVNDKARAGQQVVKGQLHATTPYGDVDVDDLENKVAVDIPEQVGRVIVFRPHFSSYSTELSAADKKWLRDVADDLRNGGDLKLQVVGHTDNVRVVPRKGRTINDNYALSAARAKSVADYLATILKLDEAHISSAGKGPDEPIADNATAQGRDANRRVELKVFAAGQEATPSLNAVAPDSGERVITLRHWVGVTEAEPVAKPVEDGKAPVADTAKKPEPAADDDGVMGILSFADGDVLADRVQAIRVRSDSRLNSSLLLDGKPIEADRIGFKKDEGKTQLLSYIGVDFGEPGTHELTLKGTDPFGNVRYNQTLKLIRAGDVARIRMVSAEGNVADGKTPVKIKIELVDTVGKVFNAATDLKIMSGDLQPMATVELDHSLAEQGTKVAVGRDGVVRFSPVSRSGLYTVTLAYSNVSEKFQFYVKPEKRDWIVVGLAQGSLAEKTLSGNMEALDAAGQNKDIMQDGRVAFFAKGQVKGEWLLTVAYDTAKANTQAFGQAINPTQYYTLYADASAPRFDAASKEKLYLRIEKDAFYALFGDYNTGMIDTTLSRYSRSLTGFKTEYHDSRYDVNAFAADSSQAFQRTELRGDGTSGIYKLGVTHILPGSDKLRLEVRDRIKPDVILKVQQLTAYADYNLDYNTGELFFKSPVMSQDENFNPIFIVAEYETDSQGKSQLNAGGRAAVKFMDGKAVVGVSTVREGSGVYGGNLQGVDAQYKLNTADTLHAEVAHSDSTSQVNGQQAGSAQLLEWKRENNTLKGRVYYTEQDAGFGLGQQSPSVGGLRTYGAQGRYQITRYWFTIVDLFEQDNISTGAKRQVEDVRFEYKRDAYSLQAGVRRATDSYADGLTPDQHSDQLTGGVTYNLIPNKVTLRGNAELGIKETSNQDFPDRIKAGVDYKVSKQLTLTGDQEFSWSKQQNTSATRGGVVYSPWEGGSVGESLVHQADESGERLLSSLGLGQRFKLTPQWTLESTYDRSDTLSGSRATSVLPQATPAYGPATGDFWAAALGGLYQKNGTKGTLRAEHRVSDTETRWNLIGGLYHELDPQLAMAGGVQGTFSTLATGEIDDTLDLRWSLAWRPDDVRWVVLNRVDLILDHNVDVTGISLQGRRLVNNLNLSRRWDHDQLSIQYGNKFVFATVTNTELSGYTDLTGIEWRHDLSETWDVGAQTSILHSWTPGVMNYSYGISAGFTPVKNAWVSIGYNFEGVSDKDFSAAEYTAQGIYLKVRAKFDQDSLAQIWTSARNGVFR